MMSFKLKCMTSLAAIAVLAGNAGAETLEQAISAALATNPQLENQRTLSDLAREDLNQARALGRPTLNLSGSAGYEYTDSDSPLSFNLGDRPIASAQLQAIQPLYTGGRISSSIRQAKAGIAASDQQLEAARQDLILDVVTAYVDVRAARDTVAIRENNVVVTSEQVRAANDRFDVGVVTRTDVSLAQARLEGATAALAGAEAAQVANEANYQFLTGLNPEALAAPPPLPPLPASIEIATQLALDVSPDLSAARHQERAAGEAIKVARSQSKPQINLVAGAGVQQTFGDAERRDSNMSAVAQGRIPLMSGGLIRSQVRSAKLQRSQAKLQIASIERQLRAQVAQAWYGYEAEQRAIDASARQVEAAQIAYDGAKEELAVGVRTTLDVLDQEQQLFEARLSLVQAERDAYVAAHRLLRATGGLKPDVLGASMGETESITRTALELDEEFVAPEVDLIEGE